MNQPINLAFFRKDKKLIGYRVFLVATGGEVGSEIELQLFNRQF